jgi:uncharacterized protein YyaL (SSP411 family)
MLEDNANLLRKLLALYRISGDQAHADVAQRVIDYMDAKLRDPAGFFSGSQDADEVFYKLSAAQRQNVAEPYIDRTCYTGWNAIAASAFLEASWALARPELKEKALMALTFAWEQCRQPGQGMYRFHDGTPQVLGLLNDQVYMARALLDACEVTTDPLYLGQAQELATFIVERFADKEGGAQTGGRLAGFFDAWDKNEQLGRLRERHKSIQDNAVCAEVFLRLYHLTRQVEYKEMAQAILEIFAPNYHLLSHFAAGYGRAVDMFLSGITEVNIVGQAGAKATKALQAAALALEVPARVVQVLDPKRDGERLAALMLPPEPSPAAYVCAGTMCSAPLTKAEELAETVRQMQGAGLKLL